MNKYYASIETAEIFNNVYNIGYEKETIGKRDFLAELFGSTLLEIEGRMIGAELLLKNEIGAEIEPEIAIEDDNSYGILSDIIMNLDDETGEGKLIFTEECKMLTERRLKALETYYEAIDNLYKIFYNPNLKALKELAGKNIGGIQ